MPEQLSLTFPEPRARRPKLTSTPAGEWLELARAVAKRLCTERVVATIDDIRQHCPLPEGLPSNLYGRVFQTDSFDAIGRLASPRGKSRGRLVIVYTLRFVAPRLDS